MISINEEFVYSIINDNLEYLVSSDIVETYNNIKIASLLSSLLLQEHYDIIHNYTLIDESIYSVFADYFTDGVASNIGRMIQALFVFGDVGLGTATATTGATSLATGSLTSYLTGLFGSWGLSTTAVTSAATGVTTTTAATAATITSGILVSLAPLLVLVAVFTFYKKIKTSEAFNVSRMVKKLDKLSNILAFSIDGRINTEFKDLLQNRCLKGQDENLRAECAINGYVKFLNKYVLTKLIENYSKYLITNNENLEGIISFHQLATFKSQSNRAVSDLMNSFYSNYVQFLKGLKVNTAVIGDSYRLLNSITQTALKVN